jgi:hypothetical protein
MTHPPGGHSSAPTHQTSSSSRLCTRDIRLSLGDCIKSRAEVTLLNHCSALELRALEKLGTPVFLNFPSHLPSFGPRDLLLSSMVHSETAGLGTLDGLPANLDTDILEFGSCPSATGGTVLTAAAPAQTPARFVPYKSYKESTATVLT